MEGTIGLKLKEEIGHYGIWGQTTRIGVLVKKIALVKIGAISTLAQI